MRRIALLLLLVVPLVVGLLRWLPPATAGDAPGCEGLTTYRAAMLAAGQEFLRAFDDDGYSFAAIESDQVLTYSSDDWTAMADHFLALNRELRDITPPDWAAEWHDLRIQHMGLLEQTLRAIATGGILMGWAFVDPLDELNANAEAAVVAASVTCDNFAAFAYEWDALDGKVDGTPVATPVALSVHVTVLRP